MNAPNLGSYRESLRAAIREDFGSGDITTLATIKSNIMAAGEYVAKENFVVCGLEVAGEVLRVFDPEIVFTPFVKDGDSVESGKVLAKIQGRASSLLAGERTSLNYLQRLSGISTTTRKYVNRIAGTGARLLDTRKTVPGMRQLDKYAVACGGGLNHRIGLFDGVLIKNNHIAFHGNVRDALHSARTNLGHSKKIEVEVKGIEELKDAIEGGADIILLDNFSISETRRAVELVAGRIVIESSGGITFENIRQFAELGVDFISVGALTHSVVVADIHLLVFPD